VNNNKLKGRGSQFNIPNRFEQIHTDHSPEHNNEDEFDLISNEKKIPTIFYNDHSRSVLVKNNSPDLGLSYSINPYRGCEHGCIYCYARPTHEYLGFSAGLDFETKIMVKKDAPELLQKEFMKKSWIPQSVFFSGNTDCYQPAERNFQITRKCLEVFLTFKNPVSIITKNALVLRDLDILKELSEMNLLRVVISVTTLKKELQRKLEPRTSSPAMRLKTIEMLSSNGISTAVNVAPVIPGLTDEEIPAILKAASDSGVVKAGRVMLRLPHSVKELFTDWLEREYPDRATKIINRIKELHGDSLYNSNFGTRMTGEGLWAETIKKIFDASCKKYGLNKPTPPLSTDLFHIPSEFRNKDQLSLF
jgi:DNA repair photolyase